MSNFIARLCQSLRDPNADPLGILPLCPLVLELQGIVGTGVRWSLFLVGWFGQGCSHPLPLLGCPWLARDFLHVLPAEAE